MIRADGKTMRIQKGERTATGRVTHELAVSMRSKVRDRQTVRQRNFRAGCSVAPAKVISQSLESEIQTQSPHVPSCVNMCECEFFISLHPLLLITWKRSS